MPGKGAAPKSGDELKRNVVALAQRTGLKAETEIQAPKVSMWMQAFLYAVIISLVIMGLFYYWFGLANRYVIFLYGHLGAGPFDGRTVSRYWMSGLVASGAAMVLYVIANWFAGRIAGIYYHRYVSPEAWRVWLLCVPFLAMGIPLITMTLHEPYLPVSIAAACTGATIGSLFLALMPGKVAAERPDELVWLMVASSGLVPSLLLLRAVEIANRLSAPTTTVYGVAVGGTLLGGGWTCFVTWLHAALRRIRWRPTHLVLGALCLSYLLLPLAHHVLLTPPEYRYISVADNFFASSPWVQGACVLVTMLVAQLATRLQYRAGRRIEM